MINKICTAYISSSDGDPLFEFVKQVSSSVIETCNSNISWKSVPGESLYEFMTNDKKVLVSELVDLYINVLLLEANR